MFSVHGCRVVLKLLDDELTVEMSRERDVSSVRLVYYLGQFYIDVVYEKEQRAPLLVGNHAAACDLNLDNLMVIVSTNPIVPSIIVDGRGIKSFNQWFNKNKSELQSKHDIILNEIKELRDKGKEIPDELLAKERELRGRLRALWAYRKRRLDDWFHKITRWLTEFLYRTGHDVFVIGTGVLEAKRNCSERLNKKVTEKFVPMPYRRLIQLLEYKCEERGIRVIEVPNEEYTSKTCCINDDIRRIQRSERPKFSGRRIARGIYRTIYNKTIEINADVNAAFNILRIYANIQPAELFEPNVLKWKLCRPIRVCFTDDVNELIERILNHR
ncbi:MAG TPA: hypothetical protein ENG16_03920 [Archaeoglobus sp.]|nr:hypothetical protein [Archaeoglobus sp.]